jgi:uncharacterized UPF0146 family protein
MPREQMQGLIEYLSRRYQRLAEIGVGNYTRVARALEDRGLRVLAVDLRPAAGDYPVVVDDVMEPRLALYREVQGIYAVRPPPELVAPLKRLARLLGVDLIIKPLAAEPVDGRLVNVAGSFFYIFPFGEDGRERWEGTARSRQLAGQQVNGERKEQSA